MKISIVILTILLILLIGVLVWKAKLVKPLKEVEKICRKDQSESLRAFACLGVIFHHITQDITSYGAVSKGPITILSSMGILFTAIFFFYSGYGLLVSVKNKENYLKGFVIHRIFSILIPFWVINGIYVIRYVVQYKASLTIAKTCKLIFGLELINGNSWFIVELALLYILFYLFFRTIKIRGIATTLLCISAIGIMVIGYRSGHENSQFYHWFKGEWWYNSTIAFVMGVLFACFKEKIERATKKVYYPLLGISLAAFIAIFFWEEKVLNQYGYYGDVIPVWIMNGQVLSLLAQSILCISFMLFVVLLNRKVTFENPILKFLFPRSIEIYLIHGMFISIFTSIRGMKDYMLFLTIIPCSIASAFVIHLLDHLFLKGISKIGGGRKPPVHYERDLIRERKEKKRKRLIKGLGITVLVLVLATTGYRLFVKYIKIPKDFERDMAGIREAEVGDLVTFGSYDTEFLSPGMEKVNWIVLYKDEKQVLLITEKGIDGYYYQRKHMSVSWKKSDMCSYLQEEMYPVLFNDLEKEVILDNPTTKDKISLLSAEEADLYFFSDKDRELDITDVAQKKGVYVNELSKANGWDMKGYRSSWWWLRGEEASITAPIVDTDGKIQMDAYWVNKPGGAIRPVIYVRTN